MRMVDRTVAGTEVSCPIRDGLCCVDCAWLMKVNGGSALACAASVIAADVSAKRARIANLFEVVAGEGGSECE